MICLLRKAILYLSIALSHVTAAVQGLGFRYKANPEVKNVLLFTGPGVEEDRESDLVTSVCATRRDLEKKKETGTSRIPAYLTLAPSLTRLVYFLRFRFSLGLGVGLNWVFGTLSWAELPHRWTNQIQGDSIAYILIEMASELWRYMYREPASLRKGFTFLRISTGCLCEPQQSAECFYFISLPTPLLYFRMRYSGM